MNQMHVHDFEIEAKHRKYKVIIAQDMRHSS